MAKKIDKTNAMRILDQHKIKYEIHTYPEEPLPAPEVARIIGKDVERVFKTLVTIGASMTNYVFIVPANDELDLKKSAKMVGEKSIAMIKQKDLLPLTGYVHGGCSPLGMKKQFKTIIHLTALNLDTIIVSAGKIGYQVEIDFKDLSSVIPILAGDIAITK